MESKNDIDKFFKNKLSDREFEIKDGFLADLEGKLDAQKSTKRYWGIIFFIALIIVGASLTYYFMTSGEVTNISNSQLIVNNSTQEIEKEAVGQVDVENNATPKNNSPASVKTNVSYSGNQSNNAAIQTNQVNNDNTSSTNVVSNHNVENILNKEGNKNNTSSSNRKATTDSNKGNSVVSNSTSKPKQTGHNSKNTNKNSKVDNKPSMPFTEEKSGQTANNNASSNAVNNVSENGNSKDVPVKSDELTDGEITLTKEVKNDSTNLEENTPVDLIALNDTILVNNGGDQIDADTVVRDTLLDENEIAEVVSDTNINEKEVVDNGDTSMPDDTKTKTKKWTVSLFGGPSLVNKKLSDSIINDYYNTRTTEESSILTMSFGARVNYSLNDKINISLGANRVTYGEDVNYSSLYNITPIDSSYLQYTYTPFQDTNGFWDTLVTTTIMDTTFFDSTFVNYSGSNRFSYIQIPVMIGYKFTFNKLSINVRLGGSYGILLKSKGDYPSLGLDNVQSADMKKTMINLVASTTISYQMKKFNIFIEPKYRFNTKSILNEPYIKQKYNVLGCNFGLSFDF